MRPFDVYSIFDINITNARGCYVYDKNGIEYLDLYCGHAVISVGHTHPKYIKRVTEQINRIGFYSNSIVNDLQIELAEKIGRISKYNDYSLFLSNSGAEANENALKLSSFLTGRKKVLYFSGSFHGRTAAAVMATDNDKIKSPMNINNNFVKVMLNDITHVQRELLSEDYCAVIIEGIQGVGGIKIPHIKFMKQLRDICTKTKTVLIIDEIQSGCGRTGKYFAHQHYNIKADLVTIAKGIGNGFPVAATIISPKFKAVLGELGTTFGGNYLACAAASAIVDIIEEEKLMMNAKEVGVYITKELRSISQIKEVRGIGLLIGVEFFKPIQELRNRLLFEYNVFTGLSGENTMRLLPPLCLSISQANDFIIKLTSCINKYFDE